VKNAMTRKQFLAEERKLKRPKYRNIKTVVDGITFDSKLEAARYNELWLMERAGEIRDLVVHPKYDIVIAGVKVCTYAADFEYEAPHGMKDFSRNWILHIEDVKAIRTPVYRLKKRLMKVVNGLTVTEWPPRKEREA